MSKLPPIAPAATPVYTFKAANGPELAAPLSPFASMATLPLSEDASQADAVAERSSSMDDPDMVGGFGQPMRQCRSQYLRETVSDITSITQ